MKQKFAVIGHPIGHSMSPYIHKKLFELSNIDCDYCTIDIAPENLKTSINELSQLSGFNVTIPHKESIIPLLNDIDDSAKKYNAVNCVKTTNGKLYGCSTDAYGFSKALETESVRLCGKVLILGCGGAAKTIAREAASYGCEITIAVLESDLPKASLLCEQLETIGAKACATEITNASGEFNLLVNATPCGMYPNVNTIANINIECIKNCKTVFDIVYNPAETLLIKTAKRYGIKTIGGMAMLVWQAVKAHEFWYNGKFENDNIKQIITDANEEMVRMFYEK